MNEQDLERPGSSGNVPAGRKMQRAGQSNIVRFTSTAFVVVAIVVWLAVAPRLFPRKAGEGFNFERSLMAALVGAVAGGVGAGVGRLIEKVRR